MGCDIHLYKEKQENGIWVTADTGWHADPDYDNEPLDIPWQNNSIGRDYDVFGFLSAGVRKPVDNAFDARGLPDDVCTLIKNQSDGWSPDGHSHSYLLLTELREAATSLLIDADDEYILKGLANIIKLFPHSANGNTHRIVFWFDN